MITSPKLQNLYLCVLKSQCRLPARVYASWVCRYGAPRLVTTDNGTESAQEFGHMLARLGCEHITISVRHPQANGAVERLVQSFKSILEKHVNNHVSSWLKSLPSVRLAYMNRIIVQLEYHRMRCSWVSGLICLYLWAMSSMLHLSVSLRLLMHLNTSKS